MTDIQRRLAPANGSRVKSIAEIVRNFTPNWFAATMGTGALALGAEPISKSSCRDSNLPSMALWLSEHWALRALRPALRRALGLLFEAPGGSFATR